jgi:cyclopropane-fatty-acyl-phospholipid synthase
MSADIDHLSAAGRFVPRPAERHWPGLAQPPVAPMRALIAKRVFRHAVRTLDVRVLLPGGEVLGAGGPGAPEMRIVRPEPFFARLAVHAKIGFGEAYMVGDWTAEDPAAVLTPFAERIATLVPPKLQNLRNLVERSQPDEEENTVDQAAANIHRHYDLSNELFETFLDETMSYSSALFRPGDDLLAAQDRKMDQVLDYAGVVGDSTVLEIGTGWGGLAIKAARRGARVTTMTISQEQKTLAEKRIAEAGLSDRVEVQLRDYREASGSYDAVVSVEMIEAVGQKYWPSYFATLDRVLNPRGRVGLQAITMPHDRMLATRNAYTWIHKYVFPGGIIPSVTAIEQNVREHTALKVAAVEDFGHDYAETLRLWRDRFTSRWQEISALGFDETFRRMWEFYLAYSEAGFRSGYLNVRQISLSR